MCRSIYFSVGELHEVKIGKRFKKSLAQTQIFINLADFSSGNLSFCVKLILGHIVPINRNVYIVVRLLKLFKFQQKSAIRLNSFSYLRNVFTRTSGGCSLFIPIKKEKKKEKNITYRPAARTYHNVSVKGLLLHVRQQYRQAIVQSVVKCSFGFDGEQYKRAVSCRGHSLCPSLRCSSFPQAVGVSVC